MNAKIQCLLIVLKLSYICYYTICITVPLIPYFVTLNKRLKGFPNDIWYYEWSVRGTGKTNS